MSSHDKQLYSNDVSSPGYIESTASTTRKSKEKLRVDQLIPSEILENSEGMKQLLEAYYTFMNLDEFIYTETAIYEDIVLDDKAVFRISDPKNENNQFFTDEQGTSSTLTLTAPNGTVVIWALNDININISNGNELPGSLALETSEVGKTFQVLFPKPDAAGYVSYNAWTAKLTTPIKNWVGPGPSHVLNNIERAMDIDNNSSAFLELMQKEIASVIPRDIAVNKRNLYKNIVDYYKVRGSSDSIEIFFRLLFNDEVEVQYPWDKTLIPSSGNWDINPALPRGGQYLDNKGQTNNVIKIQDSLRYQKFSYLIRTGQNVSTWENVFNRLVHPAGFKFFGEILMIIELSKGILGEDILEGDTLYRKVLSAMPYRQPGAIGIEDIPLLVEMFASVFLPSVQGFKHTSATINVPDSKIDNGIVTGVSVLQSGSGYLTVPTLNTSDTGTPAGFTTGTFTPVLSNGGVASVTIVNGGKDYNAPAMTAAAPGSFHFDGSDDELPDLTGVIDIVDNTIKLPAVQQASLPVGSQVAYTSGGGGSIPGLTSGGTYFVKTSTVAADSIGRISLSATLNGTTVDITGVGNNISATAGSFSVGTTYIITSTGNTNFTLIGAANSNVGTIFKATGVGVGTGTAGTTHTITGQTATFSLSKTDGIITGIEINNPGFGYSSAPAVSFNGVALSGQSIVLPNITIGIDARGRLDVDTINIISGGSGYSQAFGSVTANPNSSKLAHINISELREKKYTQPPVIVVAEPTAKDAEGVLLASNVQATAEFVFDSSSLKTLELTSGGTGYTSSPTVVVSGNATAYATVENGSVEKVVLISKGTGYTTVPTVTISGGGGSGATAIAKINEGEISGFTISNPGSGYTRDPILRIDSGAHNEIRGKDIEPILILLLNHLSDASRTNPLNNYFNRKGDTYLNSSKRYDYNETLEKLGSVQIQSTDTADINNYNVNSFIHTN